MVSYTDFIVTIVTIAIVIIEGIVTAIVIERVFKRGLKPIATVMNMTIYN